MHPPKWQPDIISWVFLRDIQGANLKPPGFAPSGGIGTEINQFRHSFTGASIKPLADFGQLVGDHAGFVAHPGQLDILVGYAQGAELGSGLARELDGNRRVGIAMDRQHRGIFKVLEQFHRCPTGHGSNGGKHSGVGCGQWPGAPAPHGVPYQVNLVVVNVEQGLYIVHGLEDILLAVAQIEPVAASLRTKDGIAALFGPLLNGGGDEPALPGGAVAVEGDDQRDGYSFFCRRGDIEVVGLLGAINVGFKGAGMNARFKRSCHGSTCQKEG